MELQIKNENLSYIRCIRTGVLTDTQTAEIIVPDTMPDAELVSDASCVCYLKGKEAYSGYARINGMATGVVIVTAGESLRRLDVNIPVSMRFESGEITPDCKITASVRVCSIDARIVNSRKISVTVVCEAEAFLFTPTETVIPADIEGDAPCRLRKSTLTLNTVCAAGERQYVISDELRIPEDKKPMEEILFSDTRIVTDSVKVVGSKAIINCTAETDIVYSSSDDGSIDTLRSDTRYTQIVELEQNADDCEVCAVSALTGVFMNSDLLASSDERRLSIEIHVVTQCFAVKTTETEIIDDLYSPVYDLGVKREDVAVSTVAPPGMLSDTFRVSSETEEAQRVYHTSVTAERWETADGKLTVTGKVSVMLLASDGALRRVTVPFRHEVTAQNVLTTDYLYLCPHFDADASVSRNGVEIRVSAEYELWGHDDKTMSMITGVSFDESRRLDLKTRPSFVLKQVTEEDGLWNLCKKYCSDEESILEANGVGSEEELLSANIILIPKTAI